mmetsp:Transcript_8999/g.14644  ORF Transcript_8999/g.14644 Transcript_8999/m.14644 type:complete len:561 (+) Transcript_8999:226-1908(+)|eukprot:CAMPEP_0203774284 /NCGR_PEP_ID=MMETSP0099_2-20121227/5209_1 /ASSEMBLY_ACC=CAM_ASM_000209 /TAXON_ID=96639 /ORGANISM=" , Strain NY0313808BC1" /LENGTH=560 /DNA_ID=CAMNT_0050672371 /DNA_START=109 /DNA_END=1791 /DNA_ORIENTATION=+
MVSKWCDLVGAPSEACTDRHGTFGGDPNEIGVYPLDASNAVLLDLVAPREWDNVQAPDDFEYDLVAIGAGAAGLVSAKQSARRGWRSALVEKHFTGGDCLNTGCVPSKALLNAAKLFKQSLNGDKFGVDIDHVNVSFQKVMTRMRTVRARIAPADSYQGAQKLGVTMYQGHAKFIGPNTLLINDDITVRFRKAVIATGAQAALPKIPGLEQGPFLTNANIFNLVELPKRLIIIGAGAVGMELGQAFQLFGSKVTILTHSKRALTREDAQAVETLENIFKSDGVDFVDSVYISHVEYLDSGVCVHSRDGGRFTADRILVATGRQANVEGLGLDAAGVTFTSAGVQVNELLQTSNPNIYAAGDCVDQMYKFTHVSGTQAQLIVENALFGGKCSTKDLVVPRVIYTEPELASVGVTPSETGPPVDVYKSVFVHNDRGIIDGATNGLVKIFCSKGTDTIIGAVIVSSHAGEMISELTMAIQFGIGLSSLGAVIHSYPTLGEAIAGCAFQFKAQHWKIKQIDGVVISKSYISKPRYIQGFTKLQVTIACALSAAITGIILVSCKR